MEIGNENGEWEWAMVVGSINFLWQVNIDFKAATSLIIISSDYRNHYLRFTLYI